MRHTWGLLENSAQVNSCNYSCMFSAFNNCRLAWSDHFWKLRCRKSARGCGAKHISKSKCTKHTILGPLLEVHISKKCTPLWREAHLEVKLLKTLGVRTTFGSSDLEKVHAVVARSTFGSQHVKNTHSVAFFASPIMIPRKTFYPRLLETWLALF